MVYNQWFFGVYPTVNFYFLNTTFFTNDAVDNVVTRKTPITARLANRVQFPACCLNHARGISVEFRGEGYEFETIHYGGPFDGSDASIISFNSTPPIVVFHPLQYNKEYVESESSLGKKLINKWKEKHLPDDIKVAVYKVEGDPEEYNDEDIVPYHYKEILSYKEYKKKYINT